MSYTSEAVVLAGYKISHEAWDYAWNRFEDGYDAYPGYVEEMFVDSNVMTSDGPFFFGTVIFAVDEDEEPREFDSILADAMTICKTSTAFAELFKSYYDQHPEEPVPQFKKYIFCRIW